MELIISWFAQEYPHLMEAMQNSNHNYKKGEVNPFHIEGDVWSHIMMVCKVAELKKYDKVIQISALLHDIGKPKVRREDPTNGFVFYTGHEVISAQMSRNIVKRMRKPFSLTKSEMKIIPMLIASHGEFYQLSKEQLIRKYKGKSSLFEKLSQLVECDINGSFATMGGVDWDMIESVVDSIK